MKNIQTARDVFQELLQKIQRNNAVKSISGRFSQIKSNSERVLFAYNILKQYHLLPEQIVDEKSNDLAKKFREEGNVKFKEKKLKHAMEFYTRSLAHAQNNSDNFSKALANRSAALFELELYEECLIDIQAALENDYPEELRSKLIKRREKAQLLIKPYQRGYFNQIPEIPEDSKSPSIQCASNSLEINNSQTEGRHIIAKANIRIGEILVIERPFCQILTTQFSSHCHECLKLCYALLPCPNCTQALFCNLGCQRNAEKYHKYECNILKTLRNLDLDKMKLLPLKIALSITESYSTILESESPINSDVYRSDRYQEIHNLVANTTSRSVADLFERAATAAIIFYLVDAYTNFFELKRNEDIFKELILLHFQTAPCNFHEISELSKTKKGYFDSQEIGAGAFPFLSLFNHSCNPNVVRHCYGNCVVVRAIRSIKKGEQCYDNYGYHFALMTKTERRANLKQQYFFECSCDVCENNWPLLQDLPLIHFDTGITNEDILNLREGDEICAEKILKDLLLKMKELERVQPNRLFSEMQEVLKQCYALSGNVRRI